MKRIADQVTDSFWKDLPDEVVIVTDDFSPGGRPRYLDRDGNEVNR